MPFRKFQWGVYPIYAKATKLSVKVRNNALRPPAFLRLAARLLILPLIIVPARAAAADGRLNLVVSLADDQGGGGLRVNGNSNLSTPRIDSLARDGAPLERHDFREGE
jgi:hypothetical protein